MTTQIEQLKQIADRPIWDGNLISKEGRDELFKIRLIDRACGWNFLTAEGVGMCCALGLLKT